MAGQLTSNYVCLGGERCYMYEGEKAQERKKEYAVTENIHSPPPHRRDCNFVGDGGVESFFKTKTLKKLTKLNWNF